MCLYTKMICPQKARKDIICYKVLLTYKSQIGHIYYTTPYIGCKVELNSTLSAKEDIIMARRHIPYSRYRVDEGYIHCFTNKIVAREYIYNYFVGGVIVECIIPKGTLYYKSIDRLQICAKKIFTRGIELESLHPIDNSAISHTYI